VGDIACNQHAEETIHVVDSACQNMEFKPITSAHIARLQEIRADYISDRYLRLIKTGEGLEVSFALQVEELEEPFRSQGLSIIREKDKNEIRSRMGAQALQLVVEENGRLIGFLDVEIESWRGVAKIWNLLVDKDHRRRGIGMGLMRRAQEFAREKDCRAIAVETQTTNWPALNFYLKIGFQVCAVDDHFYTNHDPERKEVALFLYCEL
jgi:ribosomal protein S18 acetylase RimI-like enzyme